MPNKKENPQPIWFPVYQCLPTVEVIPDEYVGSAFKAAMRLFQTQKEQAIDNPLTAVVFNVLTKGIYEAYGNYLQSIQDGLKNPNISESKRKNKQIEIDALTEQWSAVLPDAFITGTPPLHPASTTNTYTPTATPSVVGKRCNSNCTPPPIEGGYTPPPQNEPESIENIDFPWYDGKQPKQRSE